MSVAPATPGVRGAARRLAATSEAERDAALERIACGIELRADEILAANALDGEAAAGERPAIRDRLALDPGRVAALAAAVRAVAALPSPVGETIRELRPPSGIRIRKLRVPLGVVLVVYEARPNVTVDAAALCLKSANACILRGSRMAVNTNRVLTDVVRAGLAEAGLPANAVTSVEGGHDALAALIADPATADVVIPRGGEELKKLLLRESRIPVLAAAGGNCHVYVDAAADADRAVAIALNAKVQRPGVCNAAETLLVHAGRPELLERIRAVLEAAGVELAQGEEAFATEFLDLKMAVGAVASLDEAIEHINRYGTGHSEAIVTEDEAAAARFTSEVDAAAVYVNASTRFTDGGEYGMGAEIGNSTSRLHARGPVGLEELTTTKYVVHGDGHVRA
ncbi:MAG TPA: glutamate-5-semialdehyde dehydrogenase [Gaiellales bacterium]|nr:glutamate-5-semialdehyde dehydrogenase [Gaiellales bacterium]